MNQSLLWPYQAVGEPHQPPVIFLHGFMGLGVDWLPVAGHLSSRYFCLLPDLPGHGKNINLSRSEPLDFDTVSSGLITLVERLQLANVTVVGYSMGGRVALYTALKFPHNIGRLILESANPGLEQPEARQARAAADDRWAKMLRSQGMEVFVERWYQQGLFQSLQNRPRLLESAKAGRRQNQPRWMAKIIRELSPGRQPSLWGHLDRLTMPTLLLAGALDAKYCAIVQQMAAKIPGATVEIVPDAGHNIHLERPVQFIKRLVEFLQ